MIAKVKDRFSFVRLYELVDLVYVQGDKIKNTDDQIQTRNE